MNLCPYGCWHNYCAHGKKYCQFCIKCAEENLAKKKAEEIAAQIETVGARVQ